MERKKSLSFGFLVKRIQRVICGGESSLLYMFLLYFLLVSLFKLLESSPKTPIHLQDSLAGFTSQGIS